MGILVEFVMILFVGVALLSCAVSASTSQERTVPGGVCKHMTFSTVAARLNNTCSSVVNYEYFLPSGYTDVDLNSKAFSKLSDTRLAALSSGCQAAMKAYACSSIYLKCLPTGTVDKTTYPNYHLAFQRPCKSLCTPVASKCFNLLAVYGLSPNCTAVVDYTYGNLTSSNTVLQFDASNSGSSCNSLSSSTVQVASMRESYIFSSTGACSGIIKSDIFIPPGHVASTSLAPMQVPYQVQTVIENQLRTVFSSIPSTIPSACKYAMRKAYCGSYFLKSSMKLFGTASALTAPVKTKLTQLGVSVTSLMNYNLSLPSYPYRSICTSFKTTCAALLQVKPSLSLNCTAVSSSGVQTFPLANQTVVSNTVKVGANSLTLKYTTAPNLMGDSTNNNVVLTTPTYSCVDSTVAFGSNPEQYVCSRVVDYPFLLPSTYTSTYLHAQAMKKLNSSALQFLPNQCIVNVMRVACSMIYRKCPSDIDVTNQQTWNYNIYSDISVPIPVPFQRPCRSVCEDLNDSCLGLVTLFTGQTFRCSEDRYDYSGGIISISPQPYQFDQSNDDTVCNNVSASFSVSASKETYQYVSNSEDPSICAGVTTELYVPPATNFDFAPLQSPYTVQAAIENKLANISSALEGVFLTPDCRFAIKRIVCGSAFLLPQPVNIRTLLTTNSVNLTALKQYLLLDGGLSERNVTSLLEYTFYVPSFPNRSICTDFRAACPIISYKAIATGSSSVLAASCTGDDVTSAGYLEFPVANQVLGQIPFHWDSDANTYSNTTLTYLPLVSEPNYLTDASEDDETSEDDIGTSDPPFTCVNSSEAFGADPEQYVCSRVVDYNFLLPSTYTLSALNAEAVKKLNNSALQVLPNQCVVNLMRLACSLIYRKCPSGVSAYDQQTWNYDIYSDVSVLVPVPFQRPCRSVCDDLNDSCLGMLALFTGQFFQCGSDRFDYSGGAITVSPQPYKFDQSNDDTVCNKVPASFAVSSSKETYNGDSSAVASVKSFAIASSNTGVCAGITTDLYVPAASTLDLAPLQSPGKVQAAIESKLANISSALKVFLTPDCRFAIKKMVCGSSFLSPQAIHMKNLLIASNVNTTALKQFMVTKAGLSTSNFTAFLDYTFFVPSFPNRSICVDYKNACPLIAQKAVAENSSTVLAATCTDDDVTAAGYQEFPVKDQVLGHVPLHWDNYTNAYSNITLTYLALISEPNNMTDASESEANASYEPMCPSGYVVPEDPTDPGVMNVTGTACAISCSRYVSKRPF
jgi:hypothetical protein